MGSYILVQPAARTAIKPKRREGDGGLDIFTPTNECIQPGETLKWSTQLRMEPPFGWHLLALQKSRHSGMLSVEAPLIDGSYRGEIHFVIRNTGNEPLYFHRGDAVMQLLPIPTPHIDIAWDAGQLSMTERGDGGFGSTLEEG